METKEYNVNELSKILGGSIEIVWTRDGKHEVGIGGVCTIQVSTADGSVKKESLG